MLVTCASSPVGRARRSSESLSSFRMNHRLHVQNSKMEGSVRMADQPGIIVKILLCISLQFAGCTRCQTTRRTPGKRTSGSASSQVAMQANVPTTANLTSAGATQTCSINAMPTNTGG